VYIVSVLSVNSKNMSLGVELENVQKKHGHFCRIQTQINVTVLTVALPKKYSCSNSISFYLSYKIVPLFETQIALQYVAISIVIARITTPCT